MLTSEQAGQIRHRLVAERRRPGPNNIRRVVHTRDVERLLDDRLETLKILHEFVEDVEAVDNVDWPDLLETFEKAKKVVDKGLYEK